MTAFVYEPRSAALSALFARGYVEQASNLEALDAALTAGTVTFYNGYDPTARSLHVGHLLTLMAMRVLQAHGHRPIALVGGGTAMVGDPSGKTESRTMLARETIAAHAQALRGQLARFVSFDRGEDNDAILIDNAAWLLDLGLVEFLREIGVHFTINRMIATRTYRDRLDAELPLSFIEFNYQLLQAYDFLHLYRTHGCTLQVGGSDQWGNMIAGVELIRRMGHAEPEAQCLTYPLLTTADGRKMGKTERGAVWLDPDLVSPFDYFQYWVGCDDRDVEKLLRLYTEVPLAEIAELCAHSGAELRAAKHRLAHEATALVHGREAAERAAQAATQAFGGGEDWSAVPEVVIASASLRLIDLVVHEAVAGFESRRQARERVLAGAVRIDGETVVDPMRELRPDDDGVALRLQIGKKVRYRVRLSPGEP